jgi:hypothetical protein
MGKKSKLKLTIQDLKDLGIIKTKRKRKNKRSKKKVYNMDGIKSSSHHMVGYGSSNLTNNPTQQLNNENLVMQRDANLKAIKNNDETRMTAYNPQLRQLEDNYQDVKGAITHLWNVNNHYGPKIEEIDDDIDIFDRDRNDYRFDNKDITKTLSSNDFIADGDNTPSMINESYNTPPQSEKENIMGNVSIVHKPFELRAGGGISQKKEPVSYAPYFEDDFPKEADDDISVTSENTHTKLKIAKAKDKVGAPNLSVGKVALQKIYSDLGGEDVKLLTSKTQVQELRQAIRNLPQYKAVLKYSKSK